MPSSLPFFPCCSPVSPRLLSSQLQGPAPLNLAGIFPVLDLEFWKHFAFLVFLFKNMCFNLGFLSSASPAFSSLPRVVLRAACFSEGKTPPLSFGCSLGIHGPPSPPGAARVGALGTSCARVGDPHFSWLRPCTPSPSRRLRPAAASGPPPPGLLRVPASTQLRSSSDPGGQSSRSPARAPCPAAPAPSSGRRPEGAGRQVLLGQLLLGAWGAGGGSGAREEGGGGRGVGRGGLRSARPACRCGHSHPRALPRCGAGEGGPAGGPGSPGTPAFLPRGSPAWSGGHPGSGARGGAANRVWEPLIS